MKFSETDSERLLNIMRWRRDVRHFLPTPLPNEVISKLHEAFALAPSVGNSRPWRVVSVTSLAIRDQILQNHSAANLDASNDYIDGQKEQYQNLKLAGLRDAPLQLAIFTDPDPKTGHGLGRKTMPETLTYSTITAIHQLWLVARSINIGVGWVSILKPQEMNAILNVDPSWQFTAYLCIGQDRLPSEEPELQREGWQENEEFPWLIR